MSVVVNKQVSRNEEEPRYGATAVSEKERVVGWDGAESAPTGPVDDSAHPAEALPPPLPTLPLACGFLTKHFLPFVPIEDFANLRASCTEMRAAIASSSRSNSAGVSIIGAERLPTTMRYGASFGDDGVDVSQVQRLRFLVVAPDESEGTRADVVYQVNINLANALWHERDNACYKHGYYCDCNERDSDDEDSDDEEYDEVDEDEFDDEESDEGSYDGAHSDADDEVCGASSGLKEDCDTCRNVSRFPSPTGTKVEVRRKIEGGEWKTMLNTPRVVWDGMFCCACSSPGSISNDQLHCDGHDKKCNYIQKMNIGGRYFPVGRVAEANRTLRRSLACVYLCGQRIEEFASGDRKNRQFPSAEYILKELPYALHKYFPKSFDREVEYEDRPCTIAEFTYKPAKETWKWLEFYWSNVGKYNPTDLGAGDLPPWYREN